MTDTNKPVTRRSVDPHPKHGRRIVITLGPGDVIGLRLERIARTCYLKLPALYDQAELARAAALAGFNPGPCKDPFKVRNVT